MMDILSRWVVHIAGASVLAAIALAITPEGKTKNAVKFCCGIVILVSVLSIVQDFDYKNYSNFLSEYKNEVEIVSGEINEENERLSRLIIEEECESYILDKGAELGVEDLDVNLTMKWNTEGYWYPSEAEVSCSRVLTEQEKTDVGFVIESDMGIPYKNIEWRTADEN